MPFLFRYYAVLKIGKVYDFLNQVVQDQITQLYNSLRSILEKEGDIVLRARLNAFYVNGVRAKFDYSSYHTYKSLWADFQAKEIAAVSFSSGISEEELRQFLQIFLGKDLPSRGAYEKLIDLAGIEHIFIEKTAPDELYLSHEKSAVRLYFSGIYLFFYSCFLCNGK